MIGVLVFIFYQFHQSPIFFNKVEITRIEQSIYKDDYKKLEQAYIVAYNEKQTEVNNLVEAIHSNNAQSIDEARKKVKEADKKSSTIRKEAADLMKKNNPTADTNDTNYIF